MCEAESDRTLQERDPEADRQERALRRRRRGASNVAHAPRAETRSRARLVGRNFDQLPTATGATPQGVRSRQQAIATLARVLLRRQEVRSLQAGL